MKKLLIGFVLLLSLTLFASVSQACYNEVGVKVISPTIHHVFVDVNCDMRPDIVVEYEWNGYRWISTGRQWRLH